jgi:geranylgeranylglycerol-phosphate geranylgeranyltransferase
VTDLLRLVRAHNLVVAAAGVLAGGWVALGAVAVPRLLGFAALAAVGFGAAGNVLNDLRDVAADRVNRPAGERPMAAGRIRRETAHLVVGAGVFVGTVAAALVSGTALLVGLAAFAVIAVYSPFLKPSGFPGNVAIAAVAGLPLWYGALAVGSPAAGVVPWVLAAWIHLVREIVKDIEDESGDRVAGRRTLPIRWGLRRTALLAAVLALAFVPLSLALPVAAHYGGGYYAVAVIAQLAVLAAASRLFVGKTERLSRLLKGAMVVGLVALVLGRVA